ncbi:MAG: hypothetical protein AAF985_11165 [Bacteroidota bacterium]
MMKRLLLLLGLIMGTFQWLTAQQLTNTNLYVFDLEAASDSNFILSNPAFLSNFNPTGYNNQPHFIDDNLLYLTVQYPMDTTQTDIYALDLSRKTKTRVTATSESEYSPALVPFSNAEGGAFFSAVRVENDLNRSQRLWQFPLNHSTNGRPILPNVTNIGYHCWLNPREVALFLVGRNDDPHQLALANVQQEDITTITGNIGRCIHRMPRGGVAFIQKLSERSWLIKEISRNNLRPRLITAALQGSEDFVILPDGTFIAGQGNRLYKFKKSIDVSWVQIAELSSYGINNITRLALNQSGTKLVIVSK